MIHIYSIHIYLKKENIYFLIKMSCQWQSHSFCDWIFHFNLGSSSGDPFWQWVSISLHNILAPIHYPLQPLTHTWVTRSQYIQNYQHFNQETRWHPCQKCVGSIENMEVQVVISTFLYDVVNILRPRQKGRHFPDIFKYIFLNGNVYVSNETPLKFVPGVPINTTPAIFQIKAWHRPSNKPSSESMMVSLLTCMRHSTSVS